MLSTDRPLPTKVIIDFSVLAFRLTHVLEGLLSLPAFIEATEAKSEALIASIVHSQMQYVASLSFMGDAKPERYHIIYVLDTKIDGAYWRHHYLKRKDVVQARTERVEEYHKAELELHALNKLEQPKSRKRKPTMPDVTATSYKAGRKEHTVFHSEIRAHMIRSIRQNPTWSMLAFAGYEADDIAAALVKMDDGKTPIWLLTVDTDWMGLISDNVSWFCMHGYPPRIRANIDDVNVWSQSRLKCVFDLPSDLWLYKARYGDSSDNLPMLSPIEVIDLLNPPEQFALWNNNAEALQEVLDITTPSKGMSTKVAQHLDDLRRLGIRPVIQAT